MMKGDGASEDDSIMSEKEFDEKELNRRAALAKLGIAATVVYAAPTIVKLDRSANAKTRPSPCGRRRRHCRPDGRDDTWKKKRRKKRGKGDDND